MKPIIRWTITDVFEPGFEILNKSVQLFKKLYKNKFETVICYNNLSESNMKKLPLVDRLIDQSTFANSIHIYPPNAFNPAWKIYPPRLNINVQEIIIDNDLIIYEKIPELDLNMIIATEAFARSYSGPLCNKIKKNINSGFISLPPGFDLANEINTVIDKYSYNWNNYFNEQTLLAFVIENHQHFILSLDQIHIAAIECKKAKYGIHFIGANKGCKEYWNSYKNKNISIL